MQKRKGISLIVLVITIIVMIILAGAIILSLNNAGIIGKANQAVDLTNEATVKTLANLKWSEAYMEGKRTQADLEEVVLNGLVDSGVNINDYMITATTSGVTVEKVESEYSYYSTLEKAIADVNANILGSNADSTKNDAEAVIYTHNNNVYVSLLRNVTVEDIVYIYKDVNFNLGGYELSLATSSSAESILCIGSDGTNNRIATNASINGSIEGSKMVVENPVGSYAIPVTVSSNSTLDMRGGEYIATSQIASSTWGICVYPNASATITNCNINVEGNDAGNTYGIFSMGESDISNCTISSKSSGLGVGAYNSTGTMALNNCDITAKQAAIENVGGEMRVNGGTYKSYSSVVYTHGKLNMQNATIKSLESEDDYSYDANDYYQFAGRGLVIGWASNAEVYVNNCNIEGSENSIVLGKLYSEQNNKLYISNTKINTNKSILIQDSSHRLYIGTGCNFTAANTNLPTAVETTTNSYVK